VAGCLAFAQSRPPDVTFVRALCSGDETAAIISTAVSTFAAAAQRGWKETVTTCADLGMEISRAIGPSRNVVVLTSYKAIGNLGSLRLVNPHLIAYPIYLMSGSGEALQARPLKIGYVRGPVDQARLSSTLSSVLRTTVEVRLFTDSNGLLDALKTGVVQAIAVGGDDPGASLVRMLQVFDVKKLDPVVLLISVGAEDVARVRNLTDNGYGQYLFWNWTNRPVTTNIAVRTSPGNAMLEIVRSFPGRAAPDTESEAAESFRQRGGNASSRSSRVSATTLDDLPVLLSTPGAFSASDRADLGRVLSAAYLRAAYVAPNSGADGCAKDYAESASAAYLFNAFLENQADPIVSCALWAHYALTAKTAQRRPNEQNAEWLNSFAQDACRVAMTSLPPSPAQNTCRITTATSFTAQERAPYQSGVEVLRRALSSSPPDRALMSQALSCLVSAVNQKPSGNKPKCYDSGHRDAYEPYLPLAVVVATLQSAQVSR
jgi:hypothetical protein